MNKSAEIVLGVVIAVAVAFCDYLIVNKIARSTFSINAKDEMKIHAQIRSVEFEAAMNEQLTLVRQMMKMPSIKQYLIDPYNDANKEAAFRDFTSFKDSLLSKSVFWVSGTSLEFWTDMKYGYTINPSSPDDAWYNMTMY